jgi:uncharacterized protein
MAAERFTLNEEKSRFELVIDEQTSHIGIQQESPKVWRLVHTIVPDQLKGKGIASKLTLMVMEYCKSNNIKVIPECSFIVTFIERHPEWKTMLHH